MHPLRRTIAYAAPLTLALWIGCRPAGDGRLAVVERWSAAEAHELFDESRLLAPVEAGALPLECRVREDPERPGLDEVACDPPALPEAPLLVRLAVTGANRTRLRLFAGGRAPVATAHPAGEGEVGLYEFDLAGERRTALSAGGAEWRFRPEGGAAGVLAEPRAALVPRALDDDATERALGRPWRFEFDHEWREGALALPGRPLRWNVRGVPRAARLRTALASAHAGLAYRVTATGSDGVELELARGALAPSAPGAWQELDLALPGGFEAGELAFSVSSDDRSAWGAWSEPRLLGADARRARRPHIVLIVLDTLRADRLAPYGGPPALSPFLTRFAAGEAATFLRAVTPATWTLPAHVSLMSGLDATRHGVFSETNTAAFAEARTLAGLLRAAGYRTLAVTAGGFLHPRYGFAAGFDRYRYFPFETDPYGELRANVDAVLRDLAGGADEPTFLFFHSYEVHAPNRLPADPAGAEPGEIGLEMIGQHGSPKAEEGFYGRPGFQLRDLASGSQREAVAADSASLFELYDGAVAHADRELARLAAGLERAGIWQDALVAVTSDHGESLGEHGRMSHTWLDEANLRIPLLIRWPDRQSAGRGSDRLVSLLDLFPTLLAAAGAPAPAGGDGFAIDPATLAAGSRQQAWSYAASNNHGLALVLASGGKLEVLDSAWRGAPARVRLVDAARDPAESAGAPIAAADRQRLEERARERLATTLPGLWIRVVNRTGEEIRLRMRHPELQPGSVKYLLRGPELEWIRPGRAAATLAPGATGEWVLLDAPAGRLDLEGELSRPAGAAATAFRIHEPARAAGEPRRWRLERGRWFEGEARPGEVGIELRRRGGDGRGQPTADPSEDRRLREALGALGYVS